MRRHIRKYNGIFIFTYTAKLALQSFRFSVATQFIGGPSGESRDRSGLGPETATDLPLPRGLDLLAQGLSSASEAMLCVPMGRDNRHAPHPTVLDIR